jgi:hypothetical protein
MVMQIMLHRRFTAGKQRIKDGRKRYAHFRPFLEQLEDRRLLATFTELGSLLDIDLDIANEKLTVTTLPDGYQLSLANTVWSGANTGFSSGSGRGQLIVATVDISLLPTTLISIRDSASGASVEFIDSASDTKYVASVEVRLDDPGASEVIFKGTTEFLASAGIDIETTRNVRFDSGSALKTVDGDIEITANMQDVATSGNFHGVFLALNSTITTAGGDVLAKGQSGGANNSGVLVHTGSVVRALATGSITLDGIGAPSSDSLGTSVNGGEISTYNGDITIYGTGGQQGTAGAAHGVVISNGSMVSTSGTGNIALEGQAGTSSGDYNNGVYVTHRNTEVTTVSGNITMRGQGGGRGTSGSNSGVLIGASGDLDGGATVRAGGSGNLTIDGQGGILAEGDSNSGVVVDGRASAIVDSGNLQITGAGGGSADSGINHGVYVNTSGVIFAGSQGSVTVAGTGGNGSGDNNNGVYLHGANSQITSSGGDVAVTGQGGGTGTSAYNRGVLINQGGLLTATGAGTVTVNGTGGTSTGNANSGVYLYGANSQITSSGGDVAVTGQGGGTGASSFNFGIRVDSEGKISVPSSGNVSLTGSGGNGTGQQNMGLAVWNGSVISTEAGRLNIDGVGGPFNGDMNHGVDVRLEQAKVTTAGGDLNVQGIGGASDDENINARWNIGVRIGSDAVLGACDGGNTTVVGYGGVGESKENIGVQVIGVNAVISGCGGDVTVNGYAGTIGDSFNGTGVLVNMAGEISTTGSGNVRITGVGSKATGDGNRGIAIETDGARIRTVDGNIYLTGRADGAGNSGSGVGISIETQDNNKTAGIVEATGTGNIYLDGTGANTTGNSNYGVQVTGNEAAVRTAFGDIIVTGQGGGSGASASNHGIYVATGSILTDQLIDSYTSLFAVDDYRDVVGADSSPPTTILDVLANDIAGTEGPLTLLSSGLNTTSTTGTVQVDVANNKILYTPAAGFYNLDAFSYTVIDTNDATHTANVSVQVSEVGGGCNPDELASCDDGINYIIETLNPVTGAPLTQIDVGQEFEVRVSVQDARAGILPADAGLYAPYMDVLYDADLVHVKPSATPIVFADDWTVFQQGTVGIPGIINELGAAINQFEPLGNDKFELASMIFIAKAAGTTTIQLDPADVSPEHDSLVYNPQTNFIVDHKIISYGSSTLVVNATGSGGGDSGAGGNGRISLHGTGGSSTGNNNLGVVISNAATVGTGSGELEVTGVGGGSGASTTNNGIQISGALVSTTSGPLRLSGTGGLATGQYNRGVAIWHNATVTSATGNVFVNGTGGGVDAAAGNYGVQISTNTVVGTTSTGNVSIIGQGGASDGNSNNGVAVEGTGGRVETSAGNISIQGTGGGGIGDRNRGVAIWLSATVSTDSGTLEVTGIGGGSGISEDNIGIQVADALVSTTSGPLRLSGTGGLTTGKWNRGVGIWNGATVTSATGDVSVSGTGGGTGASFQNYGVQISTNTVVGTTSTGDVSIVGTGGSNDGHQNIGVVVEGTDGRVETSVGTINLVGTGGTSLGYQNSGIAIWNSGSIRSVDGTISLDGTAGGVDTSEQNHGVYIKDGSVRTSGSGNLNVYGKAGTTTGHYNDGVVVRGPDSQLLTQNGNINMVGHGGGSGVSEGNHGIALSLEGEVVSNGTGNISFESHGGTSLGDYNVGLVIRQDAELRSNEGSIDITSFAGTGTRSPGIAIADIDGGIIASAKNDINILTDAFGISPAGSITSGNTSSISIAPLTQHSRVLLGDDTSLHGAWLQLSDSELDQFNTPSLTIGNSTSGEIIFATHVSREQVTNVSLISSESIVTDGGSLDTGGGTLSLSSGSYGSLEPLSSGTDFTASTTTFGSDSQYQATINGTTVDTLYSQANITGGVNLGSATLVLAGGYVPLNGDTFTIVQNDATDAITGTFADLPEGSLVSFNTVFMQVSYQGGTGNDVTLTVVDITPTIDPVDDLTIAENSPSQTVQLTGIVAGSSVTSPIRVTASSSNMQLISLVDVTYTSNAATGSVSFTPEANMAGTTVITVVVEDGGIDDDLSTAPDNATASTSFVVTVTADHPWHNYTFPVDVDGNGQVTPSDALILINEINAGGGGELSDTRDAVEAPYLDVNKDGYLSPADCIEVINYLNQVSYVMAIDVTTTNALGEVISTVDTGSVFFLTFSSTDLRQDAKGVFAAYADVYYDTNMIELAGTAEFHAPYTNGSSVVTDSAGVLDEWGAFGGLDEPDDARVVISSIPVRAIKAGHTVFGIGGADILPLHEALLYGTAEAIPNSEIRFGSVLLEITAAEGEGEGEYAASVDAVLTELYGTDDSLR